MSGEHSCECGCHRGDGRDPSTCRCLTRPWPTKADIAAMTDDELNTFLASRGLDVRVATPDASLAKSWADSLDDVAEYERSKATPDASALRTPDPIAIGALIDNVERSLRALKDHFAPELAALASGDTEPTE